MLIASLVRHQVKEVGTVTQKENNSKCTTLTYISLVLTILCPNNGCNFALQKTKTMQRMNVLQCSENYGIHFRCAILRTQTIMQNCK